MCSFAPQIVPIGVSHVASRLKLCLTSAYFPVGAGSSEYMYNHGPAHFSVIWYSDEEDIIK